MTSAAPLAVPVRVLRLEVRRSPVLWAIPLLAALFLVDSYRTAAGLPPVWTVRSSVITNNMLLDFIGFAAGLGAWTGSREGRRRIGDLLTTTGRPALARHAAALGGTLCWLMLTFLAGVGVLYVATARQATWGGPPLWPVVIGVAAVVMVTVLGFTAGAVIPGRFTAPLAAIGVLVLNLVAYHAALNVTPASNRAVLLEPATAVPLGDAGVFYHAAPDVAIAQLMFLGGITVALLGVLAVAPAFREHHGEFFSAVRRAGRWQTAAAVALLTVGVTACWTAFALAGTAKPAVSGWDIPALHDAASDQPVPYTADCAGTTFKVCVHPAFSSYLGDANAALQPVAAEIAGLPGAPVRADQVLSGNGVRPTQGIQIPGQPPAGIISGTPPVYTYGSSDPIAPLWGTGAIMATSFWRSGFQQEFLTAFVARGAFIPTPAQQAVIGALLTKIGAQAPAFTHVDNANGQPAGPSPAQMAAAAARFEALSPAARNAWLTAHLQALRAGEITLAQLP